MRLNHRFVASARRRIFLQAETLEHRTLLSGLPSPQHVAIQVPSAYFSEQADQFSVTLVRSGAAGHGARLSPITVNFSATGGSLPWGAVSVDNIVRQQFNPDNQSVTFPAGVKTETVVVPINSGARNGGLLPVELSVSSAARGVHGSDQTVYLASSLAAVPPSIVAVQRVAGGIAITFSKPMDPATVLNLHNYAVKFSPSQKFSLVQLTGVGLYQTLNTTKQSVPLRRASYNAATNTVTLIPGEQLGSEGSYTVSSPASLLAKRNRPNKPHALSDLEGSPLMESETGGVFSITISKGHPYAAAPPVLSDGR
jgi:hypothetical protein